MRRLAHCTAISHVLLVSLAFALPLSTAATNILLPIAVIFGAQDPQYFSRLRHGMRIPALRYGLLLFGLLLLSSSYTIATAAERTHFLLKFTKLLYLPLLLPLFYESVWRQRACSAFYLAMLLSAGLSTLNVYHLLPGFTIDRYHPFSIFKSYIATSWLMAFTSYLLFSRAYHYKAYRWLYLVGVCFSLYYLLYINHGRTGYVTLLALALLFVWQHFSWRGVLFSLPFLAGFSCVIFVTSPVLSHRIAIAIHQEHQDASILERISFIEGSLKTLLKHPFLGTGVGSVAKDMQTTQNQYLTDNPHNDYLNIALQIGLIGLMSLLYFYKKLWDASHHLAHIERCEFQALLLNLFVGGLFNSLLLSITEGTFFIYWAALYLGSTPPNQPAS